MKKFLSLALALVMTMSLVTISASATFTDDSTIEYSEAVDVMYALDIIGGYSDGSFDPDATLTRGAAAKIICNLLLGPTVASALGTNTAPFSDVSVDHTFAGYIAYCSNEGIINGYSDGTFRPSNTITGFAFMKMLLGALGYDSAIEGYTATNWAVNVSADAKLAGLDDGNEDYDGSVAITREEACLYALNTLKAYVVEYDNQSNITIGDIVISNSSSADYKTRSGDYTDADYLMFFEQSFSKLSYDDVAVADAFGRPATTWIYNKDDIGTYVDYSDLEATYEGKVTKDTIYDLLGKTLVTSIDGVAGSPTIAVYVDGYNEVAEDSTDITDYAVNSSSAASAYTGNSAYTEVFVDDDNNVTIVVINTYLVQASDDYDDDDEVLDISAMAYNSDYLLSGDSIDEEISNDDVNVEIFEDEDYILVTVAYDDTDSCYYVQSAELAETITGEVSTYSLKSSVTVDGTKYSYNCTIDDTDDANGKIVPFSVGDSSTLVLDQYGNVIYVDEAIAGSDNYVFITEFAQETTSLGSNDTFLAAAYFADGTYAEITLDEINSEDIDFVAEAAGSLTNGGNYAIDEVVLDDEVTTAGSETDPSVISPYTWFTYTYSSSKGTYDLYEVTTESGVEHDIANSTVKYDGSTRGNSSTVFVVYDGDDVYSYTGIANVPDVKAGDDSIWSYAVLNTSSYATYVFVDGAEGSVKNSTTSSADYVYVLDLDSTYVDANGDTVRTYNAIIDGEVTTFDTEASYGTSGDVYALYDELLSDGDYYELGTEMSGGTIGSYEAVVAAFASSSITYGSSVLSIDDGSTDYDMYVDSDTEIFVIAMAGSGLEDDDDVSYEISNVSGTKLNSTFKDYTLGVDGTFYAVFVDDDSATLSAIYIVVDTAV